MRWRKSISRCLGAAALIVPVVLGPLATAGLAAGTVTSSPPVLAPNSVSVGRTAFYSVTWTNGGNATLTNPVVVIKLPSGSALASATPPVCAAPAPPTASDPLLVSCPQANLAAGVTVTQQLLVTLSTSGSVTAQLTADEKGSDQNKSHQDTFDALPQQVAIVSDTEHAAGGCLQNGERALATQGDVPSAANPLITSATLTGPSGVPPCVPVTVQERAPTSPADSCGDGAKCTTDVAVTDYFFTQSPSSPLQLTFTVLAGNKNLTWYKNRTALADCPGATNPPTDVGACVNSRSKSGPSVRLGVLWQPEPDPSWRG